MKKVLFVMMAAVTMGLASCGNKAQAPAEAPEAEVTIDAEEEAAASISQLTEQIEAQDANKLQKVLANISLDRKSVV